MPIDQRLLGNWLDDNGINAIRQDAETGDGLWYLTGPAARYSMPDARTLLYPIDSRKSYTRLDATANAGIHGHWRRDPDPRAGDGPGDEIIFRPDGLYVHFWDGESIFYDGSYTSTEDPRGLHLRISELRLHLRTQGDSYRLRAVWDFDQQGTFAFGRDGAGRRTVSFTPAGGTGCWTLTELAGQRLRRPTLIGAVRKDAIRKRRG